MKTCFKCGEAKPLSDFYRHSQMSDGHLGKCKECAKADTLENRRSKAGYYKEYERKRQQTVARREKKAGYWKTWAKKHPNKLRANRKLNYAVSTGRIVKSPCSVCGVDGPVEAHHEDYGKPLDVVWLCVKHHRALHKQEQEEA